MKNTQLARECAFAYERCLNRDFPGGIFNAAIVRTRAGRNQKSAGAWSWTLVGIAPDKGQPIVFGSRFSAREAVAGYSEAFFEWDRHNYGGLNVSNDYMRGVGG